MRRYLKALVSDSLFKQSSFIFVSSVLVNIFNLIFWLYMVRKLLPEDYGILNSMVSVFMIFSVPAGILQMVITRYVSQLMAHSKEAQIRFLLFYFTKVVMLFLGSIFVILLFFAPNISRFLQIEGHGSIYVLGAGLVFSSLATISLGALSGLQKFNDVAVNNMATGIGKLAGGFLFVAAGLRATGAFFGFIFSFIVSFALSYFQLPSWVRKFMTHQQERIPNFKEIYQYFLPVGLGLLCFSALTNIDIILVKHFFSPIEAGHYSVAQMVGKIVLFVPGAIGIVMFPKVVDSHARNISPLRILKKCLIVVGVLCSAASLVSIIFPSLILWILTGHNQPQVTSLVKYFAVNMSFYALVNIYMLYHVSLHRMTYIYALVLMTLLQMAGIWVFHSTLREVLLVLLVCSSVLFLAGVIITKREKAIEKY